MAYYTLPISESWAYTRSYEYPDAPDHGVVNCLFSANCPSSEENENIVVAFIIDGTSRPEYDFPHYRGSFQFFNKSSNSISITCHQTEIGAGGYVNTDNTGTNSVSSNSIRASSDIVYPGICVGLNANGTPLSIPCFTDYNAMLNYFNTGDTSGAVNTDVLNHKVEYTLNVGYSDKRVKIVGNIERQLDGDMENTNYNVGFNQSGSFNTESPKEFSYDEYMREQYGYIELNPTNDSAYRVYITLPTNGDIYTPSLSKLVSDNTCVSLTINIIGDDEDGDSEYSNEKDNIQDTNSYQNYSGDNALTKTYALDKSSLRSLGTFLWSADFWDNIKLLNNSPMENIVSIKSMPIVTGTGEGESIKIGNVTTNVTSLRTCQDGETVYTVNVGSVKIKRKFNNFIDFDKTEISINLPYIGLYNIDTRYIMGKTLNVKYMYDVVLGTVMAVLSAVGDDGVSYEFARYQGNCGIDVSISSSNRAQQEMGIVGNLLSMVTSIASGNVVGAISGGINALGQQFHSQSNGVGNPSLLPKSTNKVYIIIKRPQPFKPLKYGHNIGYVCNLHKSLKDLSGFTKIKTFQCRNMTTATSLEKEKLKELMERGVYL